MDKYAISFRFVTKNKKKLKLLKELGEKCNFNEWDFKYRNAIMQSFEIVRIFDDDVFELCKNRNKMEELELCFNEQIIK